MVDRDSHLVVYQSEELSKNKTKNETVVDKMQISKRFLELIFILLFNFVISILAEDGEVVLSHSDSSGGRHIRAVITNVRHNLIT